jgi:hypothetical protein
LARSVQTGIVASNRVVTRVDILRLCTVGRAVGGDTAARILETITAVKALRAVNAQIGSIRAIDHRQLRRPVLCRSARDAHGLPDLVLDLAWLTVAAYAAELESIPNFANATELANRTISAVSVVANDRY